ASAPALWSSWSPFLALFGNVFDAFDGDNAFAALDAEHRNTTRAAALDRNTRYGDTDGLAGIADQHQVIRLLDRKSGDDGAVLLAHIHCHDARAAAARDAILKGAGAFAKSGAGDRQH